MRTSRAPSASMPPSSASTTGAIRSICTGGSAPLHGAEIARILSIPNVVFPFGAGVSSAFGLFAGKEGITLQQTSDVPLQR